MVAEDYIKRHLRIRWRFLYALSKSRPDQMPAESAGRPLHHSSPSVMLNISTVLSSRREDHIKTSHRKPLGPRLRVFDFQRDAARPGGSAPQPYRAAPRDIFSQEKGVRAGSIASGAAAEHDKGTVQLGTAMTVPRERPVSKRRAFSCLQRAAALRCCAGVPLHLHRARRSISAPNCGIQDAPLQSGSQTPWRCYS
jgi:hypothetical protein